MSIQEIKIKSRDNIIIKHDNRITIIERDKLDGPQRTWLDNILACSESLISYNPPK